MSKAVNEMLRRVEEIRGPKSRATELLRRVAAYRDVPASTFDDAWCGKGESEGPVDPWAAARVTTMIERGDGKGHINHDRIIVFNMGLGRDSMAMLALLYEGTLQAEGFILRPQDIDAIAFADPGMEWEGTYKARKDVERMLRKIQKKTGVKIPFYSLEKPPEPAWREYLSLVAKARRKINATGLKGRAKTDAMNKELAQSRAKAWRDSLEGRSIKDKAAGGFYHLYPPITEAYAQGRPAPYVVRFGDTACTDAHKVQPIRKLMLDLALAKFGPGYKAHASWAYKVKKGRAVPHLNLLGIALGEGGPAAPRALYMHCYDPKRLDQIAALTAMRDQREDEGRPIKKLNRKIRAIERGGALYATEAYPLVEMRIPKEAETPILKRHRLNHVAKSGCVMCHSQPPEWWWLLGELAREEEWARDKFERIVEYQRASLRYRNEAGTPGSVIFKNEWQKDANGKLLPLHRRRTIEQVLPMVYRAKVLPMLERYHRQGHTKAEAMALVRRDIFAKDYAQGCRIGDANISIQQMVPLCAGHGGE